MKPKTNRLRTSVEQSEQLVCGDCGTNIYTCDSCKEYFAIDIDCWCDKDGTHYCESCKDN